MGRYVLFRFSDGVYMYVLNRNIYQQFDDDFLHLKRRMLEKMIFPKTLLIYCWSDIEIKVIIKTTIRYCLPCHCYFSHSDECLYNAANQAYHDVTLIDCLFYSHWVSNIYYTWRLNFTLFLIFQCLNIFDNNTNIVLMFLQ